MSTLQELNTVGTFFLSFPIMPDCLYKTVTMSLLGLLEHYFPSALCFPKVRVKENYTIHHDIFFPLQIETVNK